MANQNFLMNSHKLFWHLDRVNEWQSGANIAPLYIDMGITQRCNIACEYCYYAVPENQKKDTIPTESLIRFLQEAAEVGVRAIGFLGDGEPMIHPGVYDAVIAGANAGLDMAISTNGVVMKEEMLPDFLRALTWIRFNISAATPESYARVMGTAPKIFDRVVSNIAKTIETIKANQLKTTVGLQMVLTHHCIDQVVPLTKLGKELGVDYVVIKQCSEHGTLTHGLIIEDSTAYENVFAEAEAFASDTFSVIIKRRKMLQKKRSYSQCHGTWFLPQIAGSGEMYVCGNFFGNEKYFLGNIVESSFKDIIRSERYINVMKSVAEQENVHRECGLGCRQNEINEFLWTLKNPPQHVNFI